MSGITGAIEKIMAISSGTKKYGVQLSQMLNSFLQDRCQSLIQYGNS